MAKTYNNITGTTEMTLASSHCIFYCLLIGIQLPNFTKNLLINMLLGGATLATCSWRADRCQEANATSVIHYSPVIHHNISPPSSVASMARLLWK
jgi:hypothetical protein